MFLTGSYSTSSIKLFSSRMIRAGSFNLHILRSCLYLNPKRVNQCCLSNTYTRGIRHPYSSPSHGKGSINSTKETITNISSSNNTAPKSSIYDKCTTIIRNFLSPKEMPPRYTFPWYREMGLICTVFAITGTSTMIIVRPAVSEILGIKGSLKDGPWSYRICSIVIMTPIYSLLLVVVGTIFGRHAYFRHFAVKMFSRFGIPPEMIDSNFAKNAETFRKW